MSADELPPPRRSGYWCVLTGLGQAPNMNGKIVELRSNEGREPVTQMEGELQVVECLLGGVGGGNDRRQPKSIEQVCPRSAAPGVLFVFNLLHYLLSLLPVSLRDLLRSAEEPCPNRRYREGGILPQGLQIGELQLQRHGAVNADAESVPALQNSTCTSRCSEHCHWSAHRRWRTCSLQVIQPGGAANVLYACASSHVHYVSFLPIIFGPDYEPAHKIQYCNIPDSCRVSCRAVRPRRGSRSAIRQSRISCGRERFV